MEPNSLLEKSAQLRRRLGAAFVDTAFRSASRLGGAMPSAKPERHGVEVFYDIPYRYTGLPEHRLDVYRSARHMPTSAAPNAPSNALPIVLYVHGGGFRLLSKDSHWLMGLAFAKQGYLVFNISYRLAPKHPYPAALEDTCEALLWVLRNAASYGGDLSRITFAGESAGANLVTALALACSYERPEPFAQQVFAANPNPRAVVASCGVFQVSDIDRLHRRRPLSRFLRDRLEEVERCYLRGVTPQSSDGFGLADPLLRFEQDAPARPLPPFFAPVGTADPLLDDTRRLQQALTKLGGLCEARYYPKEIHAFHAFVWREQAKQCWKDTFAFLEKHL